MHERYHSRVSIEKLAVSVVEACASAREIVSKMIEFKFSKITSWFGAWGACSLAVGRTSDRAGRAPTRPFCDTRPMGGWASFSFFCSGRAGGRRLKIHAGPGGWAVDFSTGRPWASPGF